VGEAEWMPYIQIRRFDSLHCGPATGGDEVVVVVGGGSGSGGGRVKVRVRRQQEEQQEDG
jgi:hypothetical protein